MKKILFMLSMLAVCFASCNKDNGELSGDDIIQFKDENFFKVLLTVHKITIYDVEQDFGDEEYLVDVDTNRDGKISVNEAQQVRALDLTEVYFNVKEMPEIKYFTSLEYLSCSENQLVSLDVSGCDKLRALYCDENHLASLNVSNCTSLTILACEENNLTSLNLNGCSSLKNLECDTNQLNSLDLSSCIALENLWCDPLTSLTISQGQRNASWLDVVKQEYPDIEIIVK